MSTPDTDLPPSSRFVLDVVEREGEVSRQELLEATGLPAATLDRAVGRLEDRELVLRSRKPGDLTQTVLISMEG